MALLQGVAIALVGLVGALVGVIATTRREENRMRRELSLERYREGQRLFDDLIVHAGERFTAMQRWLRAIQDPEVYDLPSVRDEYFAIVRRWNGMTWSYRARLRILLGEQVALRFLDYGDDQRPNEPVSLHYRFVHVHGAIHGCEADSGDPRAAQHMLDRLNWAWSDFADDIATDLLRRSRSLMLLDDPDSDLESAAAVRS